MICLLSNIKKKFFIGKHSEFDFLKINAKYFIVDVIYLIE
jgi:hypothetical protein